ncbi:MAG: hypothetical protein ACI376_09385 [Candidatus Bruticola sp.]
MRSSHPQQTVEKLNFSVYPNWREFLSVSAIFLMLICSWVGSSLMNVQQNDKPVTATTCLTQRLLGHPCSDLWKHIWGAWWTSEELQQGRWPTQTNLQNFPKGGKLYVIDQLNALTTACLSNFFGLVAAFNLTQILKLYTSCLGAWLLARLVCQDSWNAAAAGIIYGICPFILTSGVTSAICETTNLEWMPLSLIGMALCLRSKHTNFRAIFFTSASLALSAVGSWYYAEACLISAAVLIIWAAVYKEVPILNNSEKVTIRSNNTGSISKSRFKANWFNTAMACVLSLVLASPTAFLFASSLSGPDSLLAKIDVTNRQQAANLKFFHKEGDFHNNASLAGYFLPGKGQLSVSQDVDLRCKSTYIGWLALFLASVGLWKNKKEGRFWVVLGVFAFFISSGPYLVYFGSQSFENPINIFYWIPYNFIPGFKMAVITDRFSIIVQLSVAVLAAMGLKYICSQLHFNRFFAVLVAILLINAEIMLLSPVPFPIPSSSATQPPQSLYLAAQPGNKGVIQLPLSRTDSHLQPGEYYYWQTCHRKPMALSLTTRIHPYLLTNLLTSSLFLCEDPQYGEITSGKIFASDIEALRQDGFGWICVNDQLMEKEAAAKANKILTDLLGQPKEFANRSKVYTINGT